MYRDDIPLMIPSAGFLIAADISRTRVKRMAAACGDVALIESLGGCEDSTDGRAYIVVIQERKPNMM